MDTEKNNNHAAPQEPSEDLDALKKQRDEYLAGWQRAKADFINYKKEEAERLDRIAKYQTEDLMYDLVNVMDNFDLGLAALERQGPVEKGIYMIRTQLEDILKRRGLSRLPVKAGDAFDPSVAEAIAEAEAESPPGTIVEVIEAGYKLHDKIIRPARVKVSKPPRNSDER